MTDAAVGGYANEIAQGTKSTAEVARAAELVSNGMPIFKAILQAAAETASQGPAPGSPGGAPPTAGPNSQPVPAGLAQMLAAQGAGPGQAPANPIPAAAPGMINLRHVMQGINEQVSPGAT